MVVKNFEELTTTEPRRLALSIIDAGILAVIPQTVFPPKIEYKISSKRLRICGDRYNFSQGRVFVVGGGKAAGRMAEIIESLIPPHEITAGVVTCNSSDYRPNKIRVYPAGHPLPDKNGVLGVHEMLALKTEYSINANDLVICLLSGGGSAQMPYPVDDITLEDKQTTTKVLQRSGAEIQEINIVRKHLSKVKGGQMGKYFAPATVVSIIISDVLGNDIGSIGSGPTSPDRSTFEDAYAVLEKYDLTSKVPESVKDYIKNNRGNNDLETPKTLDNCHNYIIADIQTALDGMVSKANTLGLKPLIITSAQKGEPQEAAELRAKEILSGKYAGYDVLIVGGETTPRLPPDVGMGGRNQHFVATSMLAMAGYHKPWALASIETDGSDYLPGVAGAIIDNGSFAIAFDKGLDVRSFINSYDSYNLLKSMGDTLVQTGDTATNVGDIIVYILR